MTAMMRIMFARNIKRFAILERGFFPAGNKSKFSLWVYPAADQPDTSHSVHTDIFPCQPFHSFSPRLDFNLSRTKDPSLEWKKSCAAVCWYCRAANRPLVFQAFSKGQYKLHPPAH